MDASAMATTEPALVVDMDGTLVRTDTLHEALLGLVADPAAGPALLLLLAWPAQVVRLALRAGGGRAAWERAFFLTLGKIPEAAGALEYLGRRLARRPAGLIEYK